MMRVGAIMAGLTVVLASSVFAKTTTWIGDDTDYGKEWGDVSCWDNGVPGSGDVAVIQNTITPKGVPNLGGVTLVVGAGKTVTLGVCYSGNGTLVKQGDGILLHKADNGGNKSWTGGFNGDVRVEAGEFHLQLTDKSIWGASLSNQKSSYVLGPGRIIMTGTGKLKIASYNSIVDTPIDIVSHQGVAPLLSNGPVTYASSITSDSDLMITSEYLSFTMTGDIIAPGKTVTFDRGTSQSWDWQNNIVTGKINANVVVNYNSGTSTFQFGGKSSNPLHTFVVTEARDFIMTDGAVWGGFLELTNEKSKAKLQGVSNLLYSSAVVISNGGRLTTDNEYTVRSFACNDMIYTNGRFDAASLSGSFTGSGVLNVDGSVKLWIGGASGAWSDANNWDVALPETGDTVIFPTAVTLSSENVDIGTDGITLECIGDVGGAVRFTGSGQLVKRGDGTFTSGAKYGLTGGIKIESGVLVETMTGTGFSYMTDALGTGDIVITKKGQLVIHSYLATNTQPIIVREHDGSVAAIRNQGSTIFMGAVSADCDFKIENLWDSPLFLGGISAPGHTVTYYVPDWNSPEWWHARSELKDVNGNLCIQVGNGKGVVLSMDESEAGNRLTVANGTVIFNEDALFDSISMESGSKLAIAQDVTVSCNSFLLAGESLQNGFYRSMRLPDVIDWEGKLRVGGKIGFRLIMR